MDDAMQEFEKLLGEMRPRLHRYCARMSGSVIDGEDIVQDALAKAYAARAAFGGLDNPQAWLYRIAHNAALDFLRQRARVPPMEDEDELALLASPDAPDPEIAATCLRSFMLLPALQRGAVILRDVLGHSLEQPAYFVALEFAGGQVVGVRDFLYARYAMDGVEIRTIVTPPGSTGACPTRPAP
ncbi:hypothetical protein RugamoR64_23930 [Duganella rhizosphaerae]|uniref:RNA polymerase sigma factor n=1 Tax=Duganella rhizosphaerae TaxID=2885763 RepID=UPI0030EA1D65